MANALGEFLGGVATAIRDMTGDSPEVKMKPVDFPDKIRSITTGADISGVTATAEDVLEGKVFVDSEGNKTEGGIPINEIPGIYSRKLFPDRPSFSVEKGYYSEPFNIEVRVHEGSLTVTPSKKPITKSSQGYFYRSVSCEPIPDEYQDVTGVTATAEDVRAGKVFVDAQGNEVEGALTGTIADVSEVTAEEADVLEGKVFVVSSGKKVYGSLAVDNLSPGETIVFKRQKISGFAPESTFGAYSPGYVSPAGFVLEEGKTYRVSWDGEDHTCEAFTFEYSGYPITAVGNASSLGLQGNGEPFLITYNISFDNTQIYSTQETEAHTIGIYTTPVQEVLLQDKTVTENGVVEADEGYDGLGKVIVDVLASGGGGNLKVANGNFVGKSTDITVSHNLGTIPDLVIIADADSLAGVTLSFGMIYFMAGMSQALANLTTFGFCQFGAAYGLNAWSSVSNTKDITATSDAVINNTTATQFKVGGSSYSTMPNKTYRWIAIAGLT